MDNDYTATGSTLLEDYGMKSVTAYTLNCDELENTTTASTMKTYASGWATINATGEESIVYKHWLKTGYKEDIRVMGKVISKLVSWKDDTYLSGGINYLNSTGSSPYSTIWDNCYGSGSVHMPPTPQERLKEMLMARRAPLFIPNAGRNPMRSPEDIREERARATLRRVIGDEKFRRFLRCGFVSVQAKSGLVYQIFPGHGVTAVYNKGKQVERLCVVLKGRFPPTDSLITRFLIILNNEEQFRSLGIKQGVSVRQPARVRSLDTQRSLVEIYAELKAGVKAAA